MHPEESVMPSMDIVFTQILVILLYVVIGYTAGKVHLINPEQRKYLTRICTDLILPFTILSAAGQSVSRQELANLALVMGLFLGLFILTTAVSSKIQSALRTPDRLRIATSSLLTYPNCTFLGLPLCQALFGNIAVLYNAMAMVAFNTLFFTWQVSSFSGKKGFQPRSLLTPPTVATVILILMLVAGWKFPAPVQTVFSSTGAMISPLSLIIIGVMMSENRLTAVLREKRSYLVTLFRNLLIPLASMLLHRLVPVDPASRVCLLVYIACPCATLSSIYSIQYDMEPEYAARTVLMSTIFFAGTLPLIILAGTRFLA